VRPQKQQKAPALHAPQNGYKKKDDIFFLTRITRWKLAIAKIDAEFGLQACSLRLSLLIIFTGCYPVLMLAGFQPEYFEPETRN
jgi:hypothetical protein